MHYMLLMEGAKNTLKGVPFFTQPSRAHGHGPNIFGCTFVTHFWWMSFVTHPFKMNILCTHPLKKIFKKCLCVSWKFYIIKRHDFIKFKLLHHWITIIWITKITNWVGCLNPPPFQVKMICLLHSWKNVLSPHFLKVCPPPKKKQEQISVCSCDMVLITRILVKSI